jgi:hypothetical protein
MTRLVGAAALLVAACGSNRPGASSVASAAQARPDATAPPWFLLREAGWTLHDGADLSTEAVPVLPKVKGLWFAEFISHLTPSVDAGAVVTLHDNGGGQSASEFAKTVLSDPHGAYIHPASVGTTPAVIAESPNKDGSYAGATLYWDAGTGYILSLSCTSEIDAKACETLAGSVVPVTKAEWWAAVDATQLNN